jgi:hypothetical protein
MPATTDESDAHQLPSPDFRIRDRSVEKRALPKRMNRADG